MANNVVALYIDDTGLRLLVASGKRINKWAYLPLEQGLISDGTITDEAQVAAKIQELFKDQGVRTKNVITGISGLHCLTRPFTLPLLPKSTLPEAVRQEAESILPVPLEHLYISWQIIRTSKKEIAGFFAASPRSALDPLVRTLHQAGIDPYLIDLKPLALARVANKPTAIMLDVQPNEFDIVIMVDGIPQPVRSLSFPSKAKTLSEKLPIIKGDVERTIKFYNSSHSEKPLDSDTPILVSGELAEDTEACEFLSNEVEYPVSPLLSPLEYPEDLPTSQYMTNIGLALKEIALAKSEAKLSAANLNILPEVYKPQPISLTNLAKTIAAPVIIVIAIGLLYPMVTRVQSAAANTELLKVQADATNVLLQQRIQKQQLQKEEIAALEAQVSEVIAIRDGFTSVLYHIEEQGYTTNSNLEVSTSVLPDTVELSNLNHAGDFLVVKGTAPSETETLAYARKLRGSNWFSQVIISSMEKTEEEVSFTFTLQGGRN